MKFSCVYLVSLIFMFSEVAAHAQLQDPMRLPTKNASLWYRNYAAGEDALKKRNSDLAKRYWLAALTALENDKPQVAAQDFMVLVRMSGLEYRLTHLFDENAKKPLPANEELALKKEKAEILGRIANINAKFVSDPKDKFVTVAQENHRKAEEDYKKFQAKLDPVVEE